MAIDFSTDVGRLRLRTADLSEFPYLPDEVYTNVLAESSGSLTRAAKTLATYILGILSTQGHQKLANIEVWGSDVAASYMKYLILTIKDPAFMDLHPLPYTPLTYDDYGNQIEVPMIQFKQDWERNFAGGTQNQQMRWTAYPAAYPGFDNEQML
jgi:hypothetical protein